MKKFTGFLLTVLIFLSSFLHAETFSDWQNRVENEGFLLGCISNNLLKGNIDLITLAKAKALSNLSQHKKISGHEKKENDKYSIKVTRTTINTMNAHYEVVEVKKDSNYSCVTFEKGK